MFNFIAWIAPILFRSWIAWRFTDVRRDSASFESNSGDSRDFEGVAKNWGKARSKIRFDDDTENGEDGRGEVK